MRMDQLRSKVWWDAALTRAIRTMAQTAVATIGTAALFSGVEWKTVISTAVLAGLLSILTSMSGLPEVGDNNDKG